MKTTTPTSIIILGGGGDLAQRKLLPSLCTLFIQGHLPQVFRITGLARTSRSNQEYRAFVEEALKKSDENFSQEDIDSFCMHVTYVSGSLEDSVIYATLKHTIEDFEAEADTRVNVLFYLAVPPAQYEATFINLHKSKLAVLEEGSKHWARILVEKPFGSDYNSAQKLDATLSSLFPEEQIFRIDHYLAKEAVQNILSFRFANTLLLPSWNNTAIKEVHIDMHETIDVGTRGSFYDPVGALRDVGQNHLLQILALIAMDEPEHLDATHIRKNRSDILSKLIPITKETIVTSAIRAQYETYKNTEGVAADSQTETYFEFKTFVDTPTWSGVPFIVRSGKAITKEKVSIEILFHDVASGPFQSQTCDTVGNSILLTVSPCQSMHMTLNVKQQGHGYQVEPHTMSYTWDAASVKNINAYEKVLLDCIEGDQTLFTRAEEVLASWKFITSIMEQWEVIALQTYKKGSDGPTNTLTAI